MDIIDYTGFWSVTDGPAPPPAPILAAVGHGGAEKRSYFDALLFWRRYGRKQPRPQPAELSADALQAERRREAIEQDDQEIMTLP